MIYKSYSDIARDVADWCSQLPRFAGVCGVPRAGCLIAYMISAHTNCQLISWNDLLLRQETWKQPRRRNCPGSDGRILVVDDTCATGGHMRQVKQQLAGSPYDIRYGAYMVMTQGKGEVDYFHQDVGNTDHLFEFNVLHHWYTERMFCDLDGVLSEDWRHQSETGDLAEEYNNHLLNGRCLVRPTFPLQAIVTGRLECHRDATEAWLARQGIRYGKLIMYPANNVQERQDVAGWKGQIYRDSGAVLFVESCPVQSGRIRQVSGRCVLDWTGQRLA
ncbi:MAG: hypothetical protein U0941_17785 [Planctomycetaceae bacterium]